MANFFRLSLLTSFFVASIAGAQEFRVAAAADLTVALPQIVRQFENDCHCKVDLTFGSSGNFYQQLQNGAPFDVFLSADLQYPQKLQEAGLTVPGTLTEYASGKIVLWTRKESKLNLAKGLRGLTGAEVRKIAIANPQHAPYGRAAEAALKAEGVYPAIAAKLVLGENISQTALFVQSGNADAGILALSLALNPSMTNAGRFVEIPISEYPPIRQAAVVMKRSNNIGVAKKFVKYLRSAQSIQVLQQFGFTEK